MELVLNTQDPRFHNNPLVHSISLPSCKYPLVDQLPRKKIQYVQDDSPEQGHFVSVYLTQISKHFHYGP